MSFESPNGSGAPQAPVYSPPVAPQYAPPINPSAGAPLPQGPTYANYPAAAPPPPAAPAAQPPQYQPAPAYQPPPSYQPPPPAPTFQVPSPTFTPTQPAQPVTPPAVPTSAPAPVGPQYTAEQVALYVQQAVAAATQPQPAAAPTPAPVRGEWDDIQYESSWKTLAKYDDDADQYVPANPTSLDSIGAAHKMNEAHAIRRERLERLTTQNPADIAWKAGLEQRVLDTIDQQWQAREQDRIANVKMARWLDSRKSAIYDLDQQGSVQYHQPQYIDGQWVTNARMTGYGQAVTQKLQEFSQAGLSDPDLVMEYLEALAPPAQQPPQPAQPAYQPQYQPAPQYQPQPQYAPAPQPAPQPSAQDLFLRRAEAATAQPMVSANGTLVRDAIQPTPYPVSLLDNNDYFTRSAYATGFLQPPIRR